jgi:hypothetical protein
MLFIIYKINLISCLMNEIFCVIIDRIDPQYTTFFPSREWQEVIGTPSK